MVTAEGEGRKEERAGGAACRPLGRAALPWGAEVATARLGGQTV